MPSTWSQVILHIVFSTKDRKPLIDPTLQRRLYPFMGGVVRDLGGTLWTVGGMPDHVHLLVRWTTDESIATLVRDVKHRSSQWIHETFNEHNRFAWQRGYGVFSVSKSQSERVKKYVQNQAKHHAKMDTRAELITMLKKHDIEFEEQYLD